MDEQREKDGPGPSFLGAVRRLDQFVKHAAAFQKWFLQDLGLAQKQNHSTQGINTTRSFPMYPAHFSLSFVKLSSYDGCKEWE